MILALQKQLDDLIAKLAIMCGARKIVSKIALYFVVQHKTKQIR